MWLRLVFTFLEPIQKNEKIKERTSLTSFNLPKKGPAFSVAIFWCLSKKSSIFEVSHFLSIWLFPKIDALSFHVPIQSAVLCKFTLYLATMNSFFLNHYYYPLTKTEAHLMLIYIKYTNQTFSHRKNKKITDTVHEDMYIMYLIVVVLLSIPCVWMFVCSLSLS